MQLNFLAIRWRTVFSVFMLNATETSYMDLNRKSLSSESRKSSANFRDEVKCRESSSQWCIYPEPFSKSDKVYVRRMWEKYVSNLLLWKHNRIKSLVFRCLVTIYSKSWLLWQQSSDPSLVKLGGKATNQTGFHLPHQSELKWVHSSCLWFC